MSRILSVFAHSSSRDKINQMIEQCGFDLYASYRGGAEVIRMVRRLGGGVVVSGYRLADMTVNDLADSLDGMAQLLVVASPANLELVDAPVRCLAAPLTRAEFTEAMEACLEGDAERMHARAPKRSPEDAALIAQAKELLMARGWSEPEAHSLIQRRSMQDRCRMVDTAKRVIATGRL